MKESGGGKERVCEKAKLTSNVFSKPTQEKEKKRKGAYSETLHHLTFFLFFFC